MRVNSRDLYKAMDVLREGYTKLPEDTEGMKERKYSLLDLTDEVLNDIIAYGVNNITMALIEKLYREARSKATDPCDYRCHVYGWLLSELRKKYRPKGGTF